MKRAFVILIAFCIGKSTARPEHGRYLVTSEKAVINTGSYGEKLGKRVSAPVSRKISIFQKN